MSEPLDVTRRYFLGQGACLPLGAIALGGMAEGASEPAPFKAKAKRVIFLTQSGGPSQIELFDHKPGLAKFAGTELPESVRMGQRLTTMTSGQKQLVMPARTGFYFGRKSGATVGHWLPRIAAISDELCF
ncbi:MAG: DUF1501 domain-containing protein, partial [Gemmataceae bacterium]